MAGNSKQVFKPFKVITDGNMSLSSITSQYTNIQGLDNVGYQVNFTGTPTGTFSVEISMDYQPGNGPNAEPANAGNWISLPLVPAIIAAGSPDIAYIDLNQLSAPWIRLIYTKTSGTGTLQAYVVAKAI